MGLLARYNEKKNFIVWLNEEDHCRLISMQKGGNMKEAFERFCTGVKLVSWLADKLCHFESFLSY